jgi:hypothetical protein
MIITEDLIFEVINYLGKSFNSQTDNLDAQEICKYRRWMVNEPENHDDNVMTNLELYFLLQVVFLIKKIVKIRWITINFLIMKNYKQN